MEILNWSNIDLLKILLCYKKAQPISYGKLETMLNTHT